MNSLFKNIRFYVLVFSVVLSLVIYAIVVMTIPEGTLQIIRLTQVYALTAIAYLYLVLLAGPLCFTFMWLPFRGKYLKARRAMGISVVYFALLHSSLAFFGQLGGFPGLFYLNSKYLLSISLSFIALVIFCLMASTSFDFMVRKLTFPRWKFLHRFVYLAGILVLIHALLLGTHFSNLSELIPQISIGLLAILLLLETNRIDAWLQRKFATLPKFGFTLVLAVSLIISYVLLAFVPADIPLSLGIHSQHIQIAKEVQKNTQVVPATSGTIPALKGDRTKRFTVNFKHPDRVQPKEDVPLMFEVFDAGSGNKVQLFQTIYEKTMHLIIVDSTLQYFTHIHPVQDENGFAITTQFPKDGYYHLYTNFQPYGAIEQQFGFTLKVGNPDNNRTSTNKPDTQRTKTFGQYEVILETPQPLQATEMAIGNQPFSFTFQDAKTKQPIKTLKPYLASFGHLVLINQETFDYLHVHPTNLVPPAANANGGPTVEFLPLGLYGPIKPGIYRVFAQFNPNGQLMVANFTVEVK